MALSNNLTPTIPAGVDIFREIGLGNYAGAGAAPQQQDDITPLLSRGDVPSLMQAKTLIDQRINQKVQSVKPQRPQPVRQLVPVGGQTQQQPQAPAPAPAPMPAPMPTPQPQAPKPAPAPAAPARPSQEGGMSNNLLSDITKLVKAIAPLVSTDNKATATASGPIVSNPVQPMPGRPTM